MKIHSVFVSAFLLSTASISLFAQDIVPAVLSAPGGRYVLGQISSARSDQFLLDTKSGRVWQLVIDTNNASLLQEVPFKSLDGTLSLEPPNTQQEYESINRSLTNDETNANTPLVQTNNVTNNGIEKTQ